MRALWRRQHRREERPSAALERVREEQERSDEVEVRRVVGCRADEVGLLRVLLVLESDAAGEQLVQGRGNLRGTCSVEVRCPSFFPLIPCQTQPADLDLLRSCATAIGALGGDSSASAAPGGGAGAAKRPREDDASPGGSATSTPLLDRLNSAAKAQAGGAGGGGGGGRPVIKRPKKDGEGGGGAEGE